MLFNNITLSMRGFVECSSKFYSVHDVASSDKSCFIKKGINEFYGDIDSGIWAISYYLSMFTHKPRAFKFIDEPELKVDGNLVTIKETNKLTCYLDMSYPLFSSQKAVKSLIQTGLRNHGTTISFDEIKNIFHLDEQRINRNLSCVGNEIFRAMAAIGYAWGKEIYCFPWLSQKRYEYYHNNIKDLSKILLSLDKTIVLPLGVNTTDSLVV